MALDKNQSWIGQERIEGYGKYGRMGRLSLHSCKARNDGGSCGGVGRQNPGILIGKRASIRRLIGSNSWATSSMFFNNSTNVAQRLGPIFSTTRFTSTQQLSAIALISSVLIRAISSKITSDPKRFMVITFALVLLDSGGTQVDQGSSNYRPSPLHHRPSSAPLLFILDAKPQSNCNLRNHQASRDCTVLEYGQGVSTAERSSTSSISPESVGRWSSIVAGQEILAILSDSWSSSSRWLDSTLVARTGFAKIQGQGENQASQIEIQNKHNRAHHQLWTSSEVEESEPRVQVASKFVPSDYLSRSFQTPGTELMIPTIASNRWVAKPPSYAELEDPVEGSCTSEHLALHRPKGLKNGVEKKSPPNYTAFHILAIDETGRHTRNFLAGQPPKNTYGFFEKIQATHKTGLGFY
ncbi:hypothetical protein C8R42DRAFT_647118 [Lentinula raphanica]|nr:hypothetical protein C8R42DRAFT_647118 [Lentinula raphanica]